MIFGTSHAFVFNHHLNRYVTLADGDGLAAVWIGPLTIEEFVADSNDQILGIVPISTSTKSYSIPGQLALGEALTLMNGDITPGALSEGGMAFCSRATVISNSDHGKYDGEERCSKKS